LQKNLLERAIGLNMSGNVAVHLNRWGLVPDGDVIVTRASRLLPVRRNSEPAMLKIALGQEEKNGAGLMIWWNGIGAARVLEHDGDAILLERAKGSRSLADMAANGNDDEASRIICDVVAELHAPRCSPAPKVVPLNDWFRALDPIGSREGGIFARSAGTAKMLLATPYDVVVLHGDIHHGNILDFGARGWLAIDPKGLEGERGFDYANLFCNPNYSIAAAPDRLARQVNVVAEAAKLERKRLFQWIVAWVGLSAAFLIEDGGDAHVKTTLQIAEIAAAELDNG
jgi:streptomycin 6-kinase